MRKKCLLLFSCIASVYFLSCAKEVASENSGEETTAEIVTVKYEADNAIFPNPERGL